MIRVKLPVHLRTLAQTGDEVQVEVQGAVTPNSIIGALEDQYPMLKGTIRDHNTGQRRAYLRFFACQEDWSHHSADDPVPAAVASGSEPFLIIGAISGG